MIQNNLIFIRLLLFVQLLNAAFYQDLIKLQKGKMKVSLEQKAKAKEVLLQKLQGIKMKPEQSIPNPQNAQNYQSSMPSRVLMPEMKQNIDGKSNKYFNEDQQHEIGEGKGQRNQQKEIIKDMKDNENKYVPKQEQQYFNQKQNKDPKKTFRAKRPFYEHYSKEGVYESCLAHVKEHDNPCGKPPDIPEQFLQGIQVIPKRPWVYFGPENIPPTDCQEINSHNFSRVYEEAKKQKRNTGGVVKKSGIKKKGRRNRDQFSEISDGFTSNFNISDSVDLSKDSDLISEFRSQTKKQSTPDKKQEEEDDENDDYSQFSMSGSVTQKQKYNLFDSDSSQESQDSKKLKSGIQDSLLVSDKPSSLDQSNSEKPSLSNISISEDQSSLPKKRLRKKNIESSSINKDSISSIKQSDSISISAPRRTTRRSARIQSESQLSISKKKNVPTRKANSTQKNPQKTPPKGKSKKKVQQSSEIMEQNISPSQSISLSQSISSISRRSLRKRNK